MANQNLYTCFQSHFHSDPEAVFLLGDRRILKYSDIDQESGKFLSVLKSCGVPPEDKVFMQVEKSVLLEDMCLTTLKTSIFTLKSQIHTSF